VSGQDGGTVRLMLIRTPPASAVHITLGLATLLVLLNGGATPSAQSVDPEYHLKAAVVSKFPEFVEWPTHALDQRRTIDLCVARPNPFGRMLAQLIAGESLRGRAMVTREVSNGSDLESCHLLFVPRGSNTDTRVLLSRADELHLLTVGESPRFLDDGGVINLNLIEGRIRFEVDMTAATRAGVRLSSQLLRLATHVRGGPW
jgi:hypothetical protein